MTHAPHETRITADQDAALLAYMVHLRTCDTCAHSPEQCAEGEVLMAIMFPYRDEWPARRVDPALGTGGFLLTLGNPPFPGARCHHCGAPWGRDHHALCPDAAERIMAGWSWFGVSIGLVLVGTIGLLVWMILS